MEEYYRLNYSIQCKDSHFNFFDSYTFPEIFGRVLGFIVIPVDFFGVFCVIKKTPIKFKTMRNCLLYLQFLIIFLDLLLTFFMTPFVFFPACAGFTIGFFHDWNVPMAFQTFIAIVAVSMMNLTMPIIFENRHNTIVRGKFRITRRISRFMFYLINISLPTIVQYPVFISIPDQEHAALAVLKLIPCPIEEYFKQSIFVLNIENTTALICLSITLLTGVGQMIIFSTHSMYHLRKMHNFASKNTQKLQKSVFFSLCAQLSISTSILVVPLSYIWYSIHMTYYNQALSNFCFFLIALHGCFATVVMLLCHKYYRLFIVSIFKRDFKQNSRMFHSTSSGLHSRAFYE
ncbi:unnamed protein product [Caenorhabditis angaria]|uniref:Serpentine Receptor, class H n=1 Tax=Caenorhabditis angaria TaxID=860376 RepID=A0A9P1N603_9PELO|nr:unnamed protein product [Caenorhabditis angaria]